MNMKEAKSVKDLAKDTVEALKVITGRACPECEGTGYPAYNPSSEDGELLTNEGGECFSCDGTGKLSWKWKLEPGQYFLCGGEIILLAQKTEYVRWVCNKTTLTIQYSSGQHLVAEYHYPLVKCIPILEWEEIERVLEGVVSQGVWGKCCGYKLDILGRWMQNNRKEYVATIKFRNNPIVSEIAKSRQEAVMRAVIKLGEEKHG